MSLSPWSDNVVVHSPDGSRTARIDDTVEVGMGAPTAGRLVLSTGFVLDGCNPSMVWSDDSRFLAVPRWTRSRAQELVVIDTLTGETRVAPGIFRVLQLRSFRGGVVEGVDSPIHLPAEVSADVTRMAW